MFNCNTEESSVERLLNLFGYIPIEDILKEALLVKPFEYDLCLYFRVDCYKLQ